MKKRFTEGQVIGFLGEADNDYTLVELCRWNCFSEAFATFGAARLPA